MRMIAAITERPTIERILLHIDQSPRPPPIHPARGPPEWEWDLDQLPLGEVAEAIPEDQFDLGNCSRHGPTSHFHVVERISW